MTPRPLYALTLKQPWAWAIVAAGKRIENRSWPPPPWLIGGLLAIHAGMGWDHDGGPLCNGVEPPPRDQITKGAIVAVARVAGVTEDSTDDPWFCGPFGWFLADVVPIGAVPCRGRQGLWIVESPALEHVRAGYRAARGGS